MSLFILHPHPLHRNPTTTFKCSLDNINLTPPSPLLSPLTNVLGNAMTPPPVVLARPALERDLAVSLMRSGYAAVDALNFVAMDEFQKKFFDIRSREWEKFIKKNANMRQGVLTDPRYFDFISYAQMLTVHYFIRSPEVVFKEKFQRESGEWDERIIWRDVEKLPDSRAIAREWQREVGRRVWEGMREEVGEGGFLERVDRVYEFVEKRGFCLGVERGEGFKMVVPAVLWGERALRRRRALRNDYDCFVVEWMAGEMGVGVECETRVTENSIERVWKEV